MSSSDKQMRQLILAAEREAQMVSAFARLLIVSIAATIFLMAGGTALPVAPVVLTYLGSYAVISILSAVFSLKRFFTPWMSLVFTAIDGISLALLIGFALQATGSSLNLHGAVPGFVFIFCILILATMRYTIGPTLVAFFSFTATWLIFSKVVGNTALSRTSDALFFLGPVQNSARWGFLGIATILALLAVSRRRKTLEAAISAATKTANLSRYLPDRVADIAAQQGIDALTAGSRQSATVLFTDIRGFTGISENLNPEALGALLSEFRSVISRQVEEQAGIIDKFVGDSVMAVFGVPDHLPDHPARGVRCAVGILNEVALWNAQRQEADLPSIAITIGVHSGEVFAGAVGTEDRMEFTVLGDTVNIAARLQEAAKDSASGLVVSRDLLQAADWFSPELTEWRAMAERTLHGRAGKTTLYEYIKP